MKNMKLEIREFKEPNLNEEDLEIFNKNLESDLKKIEKIPFADSNGEINLYEEGNIPFRYVQVIVPPKPSKKPWGYFFLDNLQNSSKFESKVNLGFHYITSNELRRKYFKA